MPTFVDRLQTERHFHDGQAAERSASFAAGRADLHFDDDTYLDHETWIRPAFAMLGNVRGQEILDYGCGHGMAAIVLARGGATVTAFDLSPGYVLETRRRAAANGVHVTAIAADAEHLPFEDESFDAIWGNAVLHHLDLHRAALEIRRVLRPGGVAVFCEPWGGNPLLNAARRWLPYPGKGRTPDETPLRRRDLPRLRSVFPELYWRGAQLFSMLSRVGVRSRLLNAMDHACLSGLPELQRWCRYVVIRLTKSEPGERTIS
jgi:SAM-dependent methyltransferase